MKRIITLLLCFALVFALAFSVSAAAPTETQLKEMLERDFYDRGEPLVSTNGEILGLTPNTDDLRQYLEDLWGKELPYCFVAQGFFDAHVEYYFSPMPFRIFDGTVASDPSTGGWGIHLVYHMQNSMWEVYIESSLSHDYVNEPLYWTSHNLADAEGNVYFTGKTSPFPGPLPLYYQMNHLAGEAIRTEAVPTLRQNLIPILLCGVGCLALLILLNLFGKKSQIFHL